MILPEDIIQLLVADVQDQATLRSCALVSRPFLYFSQQQIFKQVFIDARSSPLQSKWINLYRTLSCNPQLSSFVKELVIDGYSKWFYHTLDVGELLEGPGKREAMDTMMSQLLSMFPSLKHLEMEGFSDTSQCIGPLAETALARLLASPTLVSLAFSSIGRLPVWLLASSPQLKYLSFEHINAIIPTQGGLKGELPDGTEAVNLLRRLDIIALGEEAVEYLNSQHFLLSCSHLEQISLDCYGGDGKMALLWAFTRSVSHSLQRVSVKGAQPFLTNFHIYDFPLVRDWELVIPFRNIVDGTLPSLISFFSGTSTIQSVSTIHILLVFDANRKLLSGFDDADAFLWRNLDEILDGLHYSGIRSCSISTVPGVPSLSRGIPSYFPRLVARGIFKHRGHPPLLQN